MLTVSDLYAGYGKTNILKNVNFSMDSGDFLCILGANGCGKTTLLKTILGIIKPGGGSVTLDGENVHAMDVKTLARKIAYIPQAHVPPFPFTVRDVVLMGRTPFLGHMASPRASDRKIADDILDMLDIGWMADRSYTRLSGGQRQMVIVARALAQQPRMLVMDEPTASLDFGNQYVVLNKMVNLSQSGMSVIMVTHDPDHAFFCANRTIAMKDGQVIGDGTPREVIVEEAMQEIYRTPVKIANIALSPGVNAPICVPMHTPASFEGRAGRKEASRVLFPRQAEDSAKQRSSV